MHPSDRDPVAPQPAAPTAAPQLGALRCEQALGCELGEGLLWSEREQALYWVDILSRHLHRWDPASGAHQRWVFAEEISALAERASGPGLIVTLRRGFALFDPAVGGEPRYLQRAQLLAANMTGRQAALAGGLVWEHYRDDWSVDWDYNRGDRSNIFRPWGFQPGHQVEWAKLLLILDRHAPDAGHLPRARALFDRAVAMAWDPRHGGLVYGNDVEGAFYDEDKYFWVQAEALATAALLAGRTGEAGYWQWYDRLWDYSWRHLVDHEHGAWYRILGPDNRKLTDEKSPAGKTDYHTMGACYEVLRVV